MTAISAGTQILGMFKGGKKKDKGALDINRLLQFISQKALTDDPDARIDAAQAGALDIFSKFGERAIDASLGGITAGGGRIDLQDSEIGAIMSDALQRIGEPLALRAFDQKAGAFSQQVADITSIIGSATGGRGAPIQRTGPSIDPAAAASTFGKLIKDAF